MKNIRNFCVIAHIDHGKSTLSDRLLEVTKTVNSRDMVAQTLDNMDLERERGITIKSHAIQLYYTHTDGEVYTLNLIDTPGHVDFSYEVSRSIAACEGALLLIDSTQGIQAQTISNLYLAINHNLEIIPVLNKIDMPNAMVDEVSDQIIDIVGVPKEDIIHASGKTGEGVDLILAAIVERIHPPKGDPNAPLQALIFDSVFNSFRGVIAYFRIFNGTMNKGEKVRFVNTGKEYSADEIGILQLNQVPKTKLGAGDVGYIITGIKESKEIKVGDTITTVANPCKEAIHGFEDVKPMVFAGIYPIDNDDFEDLRDSLEKLQLNDASLVFEPETSVALGFGFRCGFLGMLHLEIIQERLSREFNQEVITTVPNVSYRAYTHKDGLMEIHTPNDLPDPTMVEYIEEPYIKAEVITKPEYIGAIMNLCLDKRGMLTHQHYLTTNRVELTFELPLAEIVFDFYDKLKSISRGYASFDYVPKDYRQSELVKMDIRLNGEPVDALSSLVHKDKAESLGRKICAKLKELLPRQQFMIAIQASIGAKIIARETISAMR
ncbi:MAG TPA: translation elongation factor 4, partial [Saprospiraceae bacterium]|nr:translation elongation factor 4 [Saprospiraceae bacterium]